MSLQIKRIDPYWITHPMIPVAVVGGAVLGAAGVLADKTPVWIAGGVLLGLGVLAATKPAVSAVLATLGLFGGLVTFVVKPNFQTADMTLLWKLFSTVLFSVLYTILMDALVLGIAVLYNFFSAVLGGVSLDIEESSGEEV